MNDPEPNATPPPETNSGQQVLLAAYTELCNSYHAIDDFRAKLLALLPIASGTGGILLLANHDSVFTYLGPIGVFGFFATLGLFFYEIRGIQTCTSIIDAGKELEEKLEMEQAHFLSRPPRILGFIGAGTAGFIVYIAVLVGWAYLAFVGFWGEQPSATR